MERLTKKNPETNLERLLNFAIAEDKQVVLDYGFEKKPLVQVVVEKAKSMDCDATEQAVMYEGQCMECDCAVALMNMLGIQAAELHARLSLIEDILGDEYDLDRLAELVRAEKEGRIKILTGFECPACGEKTLFARVDKAFYYCHSCKTRFSKEEAEKVLKERENNG